MINTASHLSRCYALAKTAILAVEISFDGHCGFYNVNSASTNVSSDFLWAAHIDIHLAVHQRI
jgi:hypothetical protein